ncbi:hypothetical protein BKA67DRAFT_572737 [Truncatella angustata]|uniref:Glutaminase A central domain-containing protein n=1 Tax=Truncatella angustata TaxID=152316 RepID=A0A9P8UH47_9PEZI|nr:uncharacterized protein BKA67DRAFT_572737 [Truncatella angustata]KAH6652041.1 hypothetical protein BKA67DRAFT_572737 [Truncatella angustata]
MYKSGIANSDLSEAEAYNAIVDLSARQVMAASVLAAPPYQKPLGNTELEPLLFMKEISSDGNMNTMDVLYPTSPFFLYTNPDLLRFALQPLYEMRENSFYPNDYTMHDLGGNFPNATGHLKGDDEYMPVEECGNLILMSYAYYKFSGDISWLRSHYKTLTDSAQYLLDFSLLPASQMSTDDFNGELANQTNLAIKGIIALQAMSSVAIVVENLENASMYAAKAKEYYVGWEELSVEPSRQHTVLSYQWTSSWGLLYNIYFDKLLNIGIVNESIYNMQSDWYAKVSQVFGVPLDSRKTQTKSDWQIWAAATSSSNTREMIIRSMATWLDSTASTDPFPDRYETFGNGQNIGFKARPVVGGHFALLALAKSGQRANAEGGVMNGSRFSRSGDGFLQVKPVSKFSKPLKWFELPS